MIEIDKTYIRGPYDVGGRQFEFTPDRVADLTYNRNEEYCWAEGGILSSGFYCCKVVETIHLWLNVETNTCVELVERKDYDVDIGFFGNGWKLKRKHIVGPNKYTIKPEYPKLNLDMACIHILECMQADSESILHKYGLPMDIKSKIMEMVGENIKPKRIIYKV